MSYSTAYSTGFDTVDGTPPVPAVAGPLTLFREAVAAALAPIPEVQAGDWTVLPTAVDAVVPPCYLLDWGPDPGGTIATVCTDTAQLEVVCVAGRLTPEADVALWEAMVDQARVALAAAGLRPFQWLVPGPFEVGQVTYLAGRVQIRQPVTIGVP